MVTRLAGPIGIALGVVAAVVIVVAIVLLRRNEGALEEKAVREMAKGGEAALEPEG